MTGYHELPYSGDIHRCRDLEVMLDAITDYAIVRLDAAGRVAVWSRGAEALLGYTADEVVGQHVSIFYPEVDKAAGAVERALETSAARGRVEFEGLRVRKDGTRFAARGVNTALRDESNTLSGYATILQDVTERQRHEAMQARMAAIARSSDDAMFSMTVDRVIDTWNGGAEHLFGYRDAEIVGQPVTILVPDQERDELELIIKRLRAGEHVVRYDSFRRRKDGSLVEVDVSLSAMRDARGALLGYTAVLRDLGDRRRAEAELTAARAREQILEERDRIGRDLHDLVIHRLFAAGMTLEATRSLVQHEEATTRLEQVIEDLDATIGEIRATIYALGHHLQPGSGLRARLLEITSEAAGHLGFEPRIRFVGSIDTLVPPEVAEHLLATAREALRNVSRHADASAAEIHVQAGDEITLVVSDNGRGISDASPRRGLADLARRAETLRGTFVVEPASGGGTRLQWRVPTPVGAHREE